MELNIGDKVTVATYDMSKGGGPETIIDIGILNDISTFGKTKHNFGNMDQLYPEDMPDDNDKTYMVGVYWYYDEIAFAVRAFRDGDKIQHDNDNDKIHHDNDNVSKTFDQDYEVSMKEQKLYTTINEFKQHINENLSKKK